MEGLALSNVRVFRRPSRMTERRSRISGSGRVALPDIREWSGDPAKCLGVVGRPSRMSGIRLKSLLEVWETLSDVRSGRESLPDVREWSLGPLGGPEVVGRPTLMSGND